MIFCLPYLILNRVEVDRAVAIRYAVEQAAANDIILIAGKGHENYQDVQGVKHHSPILKSQKKHWQSAVKPYRKYSDGPKP